MATSAGHPGRPNEDFVGAVPGAVVLLDGAGIPDTETICRHGVAWYAQTLGAALLTRLAAVAPAEALADAIENVAGQHRHTCDLADPSSPQATVAVARFVDEHVEYLVLADAFAVLGPRAVTDPREVEVRTECLASYADHSSVVDAFRARRNQPGGYWIAKDDPRAAAEAVTGRVPLADLDAVALLSNGAGRIVAPYGLMDWPGVIRLLRDAGAEELLRRVRRADSETPDDATVAFWRPPT